MDYLFCGLVFILCAIVILFIMNYDKELHGERTIKSVYFGIVFFFLLIPGIIFIIDYYNRIIVDSDRYFLLETHSLYEHYFNLFVVVCVIVVSRLFYGYFNKKNIKLVFDEEKKNRILSYIIYFSFSVGIICFFILVYSFGGIANMLSYGEINRSFIYDVDSIIGKASLLIVPSRLILVTPILCLISNKKKYRILLYISFPVAILLLLYISGKASLIIYFLYLLIPFLKKYTKHVWKFSIVIGLIAIPFINILDSLFGYFTTGIYNWDGVSVNNLLGFLYPYENLTNRTGIANVFGFRYGKDFITSFLEFLPGMSFQSSYIPTSIFYKGFEFTSGTPNDILTFSFLQLGYFGLLGLSIFLAFLCAKIDERIVLLKKNHGNEILKAVLIIQMFSLISNADFVNIIKTNILFVIVTVVLLVSCKWKGNAKC